MGVARFPFRIRSRSLLSPLLSISDLSVEIAACGVDPVVTRDRSQSRLGRALATRGRSGGARRSVSTDVCNPQDFFSTTRSASRSTPNRDSHAIREAPVRSPAIRFGEPTLPGRRASDVRSIFRGERSGRAPRSRCRESREPSVGSGRLRLPCAPPERSAKRASAVIFQPTRGRFSRTWSSLPSKRAARFDRRQSRRPSLAKPERTGADAPMG